jgi:hypothetical protein
MFAIYCNFTAFFGFAVKTIINYSNADRQKCKLAWRNTLFFGLVKQTVDNQPSGFIMPIAEEKVWILEFRIWNLFVIWIL